MTGTQMKFACFDDWESLPRSADKLFAEGGEESIFNSRLWFENLVETGLKEDQAMLLACVLDGDSVLAVLPLKKPAGSTRS